MNYEFVSDGNFKFRNDEQTKIMFKTVSDGDPVLVLDKDGMTYKGQRIEDAGEAHKAFMEVMGMMPRP